MHIITVTIALEDGTDDKMAEIVRAKTFRMVTEFMKFMNQENSTVACTMESAKEK